MLDYDGRTYKGVTKAPARQDHAHSHAHVRRSKEVADDCREHGHDASDGESRDEDENDDDAQSAGKRPDHKHACTEQRQRGNENVERADFVADEARSDAADSRRCVEACDQSGAGAAGETDRFGKGWHAVWWDVDGEDADCAS